MSDPIVVEARRSGTVESVHLVEVAVVDGRGRLVASAGDPERAAAFRSSAKPIQARVARESGWEPPSRALLALACASHVAEPVHVEGVRAILAAAGLDEEALRCPADVPADVEALLAATERRRVAHNCSGKHAAMLAACVASGWPLETYRDREHPLQQRVLARIAELTGVTGPVLVDGCGVPTPVAPLRALARAFGAIDDGGDEGAAMRAEPRMVRGTARLDTDVMRLAPHLMVKSGAEGLVCASGTDVAVAVKARDGAARATGPALLLALRALDLLDEATLAALGGHARPVVTGGGEPVGEIEAIGRLGAAGRP